MYYDEDADLNLLKGKTVAVIGFGSQATHMPRTSKRVGSTLWWRRPKVLRAGIAQWRLE